MPSPTLPLTDARWHALTTRDRSADGAFVYAVRTTGVFCRPSCSARTPNRQNVVLYLRPRNAEAAGFRACRRCRPNDVSALDPKTSQARSYLETRLGQDPEAMVPLAELAAHVGWSVGHLQRRFSAAFGLSPAGFADAWRVERAKNALRSGEGVLAATYAGGFGTGKALYDRADDAFGMTPGTWKKGGAGERVRYALFSTALGVALVAATDRGVCAVALGDDADGLVEALRADLFEAALFRDDEALGPWAEPVLRLLAGAPGDAADALLRVPLDVRGTAFQHQVWRALRTIPVGETRSYAEVAARIGRPTASRAVARACGANRLALVVPCHRVVGTDGALRGYRWGPERKRTLLDLERARER